MKWKMSEQKQPERVALVTGGSRGIGRAIAVALAGRSWNVIINYRGNQDAATECLRLVERAGGHGLLIQADVASAPNRERLVTEALSHFGRIDLLVNNAGMAPRQRLDILETTETSYDEVMAVNLKGPFFLTQQVARVMIRQQETDKAAQPQIVNIGSISAFTSSTQRGEYCLSKAGMGMMTALFADRLAGHNIAVFEIRPGIIETDMTSAVKAKYDMLFAQGITPIQRWGQPEDVAQVVLAIAEGYLPYATGEVINVDGGFHLQRL